MDEIETKHLEALEYHLRQALNNDAWTRNGLTGRQNYDLNTMLKRVKKNIQKNEVTK